MKIVGDIGGTKSLLALVNDAESIQREERLASVDFSDFPALLAAYLRDDAPAITGGCLAVAGPVADDGRSARITNLPWVIDAAKLEARFGLGPLRLVNDFAAAALGVTVLAPEHRVTLQTGEPLVDGVKLVVGAGTGLGMAVLVPQNGGWRVLPGEGGHVGFAPADADQLKVWQALLAEHGRVTNERVISGPGLAAIHRILAGEAGEPAAIAAAALADPCGTARHSVELFLSAYGAFAGDMALAVMARGGVYLAGGIAAKLMPLLQEKTFIAAFNAKAEHADLVSRMPVHVVVEERLGLLGAAEFARF